MNGPAPIRSRIAFSALASLAILSEYVAGIFLIACHARADCRRRARSRTPPAAAHNALPRRLAADLLTFLPPALVGALLYCSSPADGSRA